MHTITIKGVEVPALGFGTWQLRGSTCERAVAHALDVGYRHVDTAQMYRNEDRVGAALAGSSVDRADVFVTTKLGNGNHAPAAVRSSTEESLRMLRTDYVDLLLIHWPTRAVPTEQTLDAMVELREEGKVRHVGVSNFRPDQVEHAIAHAPIFADQVEYHPFLRQGPLLELAAKHDFTVTAYSPLAQGGVLRDDTIAEVARRNDASPTQVALAWLLAQDKVTAIPKATSPQHIETNFAALDVELGDDDLARISALTRG